MVQTRLAGAAHWPTLGSAAQRLTGAVSRHPLAWLPGLAAASALCLLVGAPQAWAAMLSDSSRQALQATPTLLRQAFSANLDQAGQALLAQGVASLLAAKKRQDREQGQPTLGADAPGLAADAAGLAAEGAGLAAAQPRRDGRARRQADPAGQGAGVGLALPPVPAVRGRGVPRRARHACR